MAFDPASRYRLVHQATMQPGICLITKTDKGPFVDTGMDLNKFDPIWSGVNQARIYLSVDVIRELAEGAGLFEEQRDREAVVAAVEHNAGFVEGLNSHGDIALLADRLDAAAARLRRTSGVADEVIPAGSGDDDSVVLVTDGPERGAVGEDGDGADRKHGAAGGQSDGAGSKQRPALVPSGSGDGDNPFRI